MKLFKFGVDEDGDVVFCVAGLVSFTEYRGAVLVSWGDETRHTWKTPDSWATIDCTLKDIDDMYVPVPRED